MSESYEERNSEQIQQEIDHTRAEMDETLDALRGKFSPGELLDQALDYFKSSGSNQFAHNLSTAVQHNPIPVTLVGVGLAWLMISGTRGSPPSPPSRTTNGVQDRMRESAASAAGRAGQMTHAARERGSELRERIGEVTDSTRHRAGETADYMRDRARQQAAQVSNTYHYLRTEQPLVLGVLGFALGAALGAGLPPTRREDELMGEARDDYLHQAVAKGQEQLEKVQHVAEAAGQAAKDQSQAEGLSPQDANQRRRETAAEVSSGTPPSHGADEPQANPQTGPARSSTSRSQ